MNVFRRHPWMVVALVLGGSQAGIAADLPSGAAAPATPKASIKFERDPQKLAAVRSGELGQHLQRMGEELRDLTNARLAGKALPELSTDDLRTEHLPNGLTRVRLGVSQLNTTVVRLDDAEAVLACVDGAPKSLPAVVEGSEVTQ